MTPKKKSPKPAQELTNDEVMERVFPKDLVKKIKEAAQEKPKKKGDS